jgi:membrane protein implicated in regulation of membrane protease activity
MESFIDHHHLIWYAIAGVSLVIELGVMGLSGPLLFFGIASVVTGVLVHVGVIEGWQSEVLVVGVLTAVITVLLWKPLKKIQNSRGKTDDSSDMIGLQVPVIDDITTTVGTIRYSGVNWHARLADNSTVDVIKNNSICLIVAVTGTTMLVKPVD